MHGFDALEIWIGDDRAQIDDQLPRPERRRLVQPDQPGHRPHRRRRLRHAQPSSATSPASRTTWWRRRPTIPADLSAVADTLSANVNAGHVVRHQRPDGARLRRRRVDRPDGVARARRSDDDQHHRRRRRHQRRHPEPDLGRVRHASSTTSTPTTTRDARRTSRPAPGRSTSSATRITPDDVQTVADRSTPCRWPAPRRAASRRPRRCRSPASPRTSGWS